MEKKNFLYDDFSDRLLISRKQEGDVVAGSVRFLNLVIDFTTENKIINIELRKASDYLKSLGVNPKILDNLTDARLMFKQCRDGYLISFVLQSGDCVERIPYNIQSPKIPVLN